MFLFLAHSLAYVSHLLMAYRYWNEYHILRQHGQHLGLVRLLK